VKSNLTFLSLALALAIPSASKAQSTLIPPSFPTTLSTPSVSAIPIPASDWVIDIGTCIPGIPCKTSIFDTQIGAYTRFDFAASATIQQADVSIGSGHPQSWGQWNFGNASKLVFHFRDRNNTLGLYHYVLTYDDRGCYRSWLFNHPAFNSGRVLQPNIWYQIAVNLRGTKGIEFYDQAGVPSVCADTSVFNFNRIKYFEVGVFGPAVRQSTRYTFEVGSHFLLTP
jgi:hypothetical protein